MTCQNGSGEVNTVHFNCGLSAAAKCRNWRTVLSLLEDMELLKVSTDAVSFSSAVAACGASWRLALLLWARMEPQKSLG